MNEHIFNQLIRVYTGAIRVDGMKDDHIEAICKDAWLLYEQFQDAPNCEISVEVLNSLVQLYCVALKPHDIEAKVLP